MKREAAARAREAKASARQEEWATYPREEAEVEGRYSAWTDGQIEVIREVRRQASLRRDPPPDFDTYWLQRLELALTREFVSFLDQYPQPAFALVDAGGEERPLTTGEVAALLWRHLRDSTFSYPSRPPGRTLHDDFVAAARARRRSFPHAKLAAAIGPVLADLMSVKEGEPYLRVVDAEQEQAGRGHWHSPYELASGISGGVQFVFDAESSLDDLSSEK